MTLPKGINMKNNVEKSRFELEVDGHIAFATYSMNGNVATIPHVFTPVELRGTGVAGRLMQGIMDYAKSNNLKIHPVCPYAVSWLDKHKEFDSLRS
jgi:uncharacterized protein